MKRLVTYYLNGDFQNSSVEYTPIAYLKVWFWKIGENPAWPRTYKIEKL